MLRAARRVGPRSAPSTPLICLHGAPSISVQMRMCGDFVVGVASDAVCNASDPAGMG